MSIKVMLRYLIFDRTYIKVTQQVISMISVNVTNQVRHDLKIYDNKKSTIEISTKILK